MCRWAAYIGQAILIEKLLFDPAHSLIEQSRAAKECKTSVNGDGFGLAWYGDRAEPGLYRDIYPAWSDPNLRSLAHQISSPLFLAHVRASTGAATSRNNCHPFSVGKWSFMHNGQIGGFDDFRKRADMLIPDELYQYRKGATDSEVLFLLALGAGLDVDPIFAIRKAMEQLLALSVEFGTAPHLRLSSVLSDGHNALAIRAASDEMAPSLYYKFDVAMGGHVIVSEPLDFKAEDWREIPQGWAYEFLADGTLKKHRLNQITFA